MRDLVQLQAAADHRQTQREERIGTLEKDLHEFHSNYMQLQTHLTKLVVERDDLGRQLHAQHRTQAPPEADLRARSPNITPPLSHRYSDMDRDANLPVAASLGQPGRQEGSHSLHLPARNQLRPMALSASYDDLEYRANSAPPSNSAHHVLAERLWAATRSTSATQPENVHASTGQERAMPDKQAFLNMLRSRTTE